MDCRLSHRLVKHAVVVVAFLCTCTLVSCQQAGRGPGVAQRFKQLDRNGDGKLTPDELRQPELFKQLDGNADGSVTLEEAQAYLAAARGGNADRQSPALPPPSRKDVQYGPHERNVLDLWQAKSDNPTPLIVFIHGGGFVGGDKSNLSPAALQRALDGGASVMAINYRFREHAPIQDILRDCTRAIQFVRLHAQEYNIDPKRVASFGGSAGAGTSLWLAAHDDLADPKSEDPVLQQSSRISAAACLNPQATYNLLEWQRVIFPVKQEWLAGPTEVVDFYHFKSEADFETERGRQILADCNMIGLLSPDDPPIWMHCSQPDGEPTSRGHLLHHPKHVQVVKQRAEEVGVKVEAHFKGGEGENGEQGGIPAVLAVEFLLKHLGAP